MKSIVIDNICETKMFRFNDIFLAQLLIIYVSVCSLVLILIPINRVLV